MLSGFGDASLFDINLLKNNVHKFSAFTQDNFHFASLDMMNMKYDEKVDIWAVGILTYLLFTGKLPFNGEDKG